MNKDTVKGQFNEIVGKVRHKWAEYSENDFEKLKASYQELKGELQKKYGEKKEKVHKKLATVDKKKAPVKHKVKVNKK